ncbi:MAG: RluA family pseudouridine synthase [Alphaproteobacteria bacterium]|nr:RluA family pseudouridine synthase [Alphaproteobacteria bacterium]
MAGAEFGDVSVTKAIVTDADDDIRLDRWFKRHYPGIPHGMVEKQLRKGLIRLDGKKAKSSDHIHTGQEIQIKFELTGDAEKKPQKTHVKMSPIEPEDVLMMQKSVLYKDANVIVINKPFGLPVQGGSKVSKSVDDLLGAIQFDAPDRPKLVHRLDRDTSGVLVLARNTKTAAILSRAFSGKDMQKTYWALVSGTPLDFKGTIDYKLIKAVAGENSFERVAVDDEDGKYAKTDYRVIEHLARKFSLMELIPLTGRTHQLRVHCAAIGCPIVGDHKYGGSMPDAKSLGVENVLHLHARRIQIPAQGGLKAIDVKAPLPPHMKQSFEALGIEVPR